MTLKETENFREGEIVELLGGEEVVIQAMNDLQMVFERLNQEQDALVKEYPYKWVIMGGNGILAIEDSLESVREFIKVNDLKNPKFLVKYLDPNPPVLIP